MQPQTQEKKSLIQKLDEALLKINNPLFYLLFVMSVQFIPSLHFHRNADEAC